MTTPIPAMAKTLMLIALVLAVYGAYLEINVNYEEAAFHDLQTNYFVENTKSERDSAAAGSELNQQLATIKNYPSILMYHKLGGIASLLGGIFVTLMGILQALAMMPSKLGTIIRKK